MKIIAHTDDGDNIEIMVPSNFNVGTGLFGPQFSQTGTGLSNEAVWGGAGQQSLFPCAAGIKGPGPRRKGPAATNYCCHNWGRAM